MTRCAGPVSIETNVIWQTPLMGQKPRDDKSTPSLELPSLPGFGRRKKVRRSGRDATATLTRGPAPGEVPDEVASPVDLEAPESLPEQDLAGPPAENRAEKKRDKAARRKTRSPRTTPLVPGALAAVLTGLLVGAAGAAGTYGAMTGCKALRGVSSCGGGLGLLSLVAVVVLMVLLGAGILRLLKVGDPGSTSFLAVGLVAVISMLVLLDVIFSPVMFAVIPVLTAVAFWLARWVTTRFAGDKGRRDWT